MNSLNEKFLADRTICPRCKSANIGDDLISTGGDYDYAWTDWKCNDCNLEWTVVNSLFMMVYDEEEELIEKQTECPRCKSAMFWDIYGEGDEEKVRLYITCTDCGVDWVLWYHFSKVVLSKEFYSSEERDE